jgi:dUTPase
MVDTGIVVMHQVGQGAVTLILPRSSWSKTGLYLRNTIGVVDLDYCGPGDTLKVALGRECDPDQKDPLVYKKGDRFCQLLFVPVFQPSIHEVSVTDKQADRGGFGSTGV